MAEENEELENPALIPDYDGKPLTDLPYEMIVKIYEKLDNGSPEALSATCTDMKNVFHDIEDRLKLPVDEELVLRCWKDEVRVTTETGAHWELKKYKNPTLKQFKRLLRFIEMIRIDGDVQLPWFTCATAPNYDHLKEFLLDCNVKSIYVDMASYVESTTDSVLMDTFNLFPDSTNKFLQVEKKVEGGTRYQEVLTGFNRLALITVGELGDLLRNKNLQILNVSLKTRNVNYINYIEEWKRGERTITKWIVRSDVRQSKSKRLFERMKDGVREHLLFEKRRYTCSIELLTGDEENGFEEFAEEFEVDSSDSDEFDSDDSDSEDSDSDESDSEDDEEEEEKEEEVEEDDEEEDENEDVDVHDEEEEEEDEDPYSGCEEYDRDDDEEEEEVYEDVLMESDADDEEEDEEDEEDENRERFW